MKIRVCLWGWLLVAVVGVPGASATEMDTTAALSLADQYYSAGNLAKAQVLYEKALQAGGIPKQLMPGIYYQLGRCYHYADRTDSAIACFKAVGEGDPKTKLRDMGRKWLGDCYVIRNDLNTAIAVYRSILADGADPAALALAHYELASTLFKKMDYAGASVEFKSFIGRYPKHTLVKQANFYMRRIQNATR